MRIVLKYIKASHVTEELDLSVHVLRFIQLEPKDGNYRKTVSTQCNNCLTISLTSSLRSKALPITAGAQSNSQWPPDMNASKVILA